MRIKNFYANLEGIEPSEIDVKDIDTLRKILSFKTVSFILEDITRLQSMLLCELGCSYVQKSQRYTVEDELITDNKYHEKVYRKAKDLYDRMTELKDKTKNKTGSLKIDDYVHGIPIEDARYILPICAKTTMIMTIPGEKLLDFFKLLNRESIIFADINAKLIDEFYMYSKEARIIYDALNIIKYEDKDLFYEPSSELCDNEVVLTQMTPIPEVVCGISAMISRNTSEILEFEEYDDGVPNKVLNNVIGYGHTSVLEQCRETVHFQCSIVTYHQYIRHRLFNTFRCTLEDILTKNKYILPESIKQSKFYDEVVDYINYVRDLKNQIIESYTVYGLILNCDVVDVSTISNARMENQFLKERLCNNAQWEIKEHAFNRYKALVEKSGSKIMFKDALSSCVTGQCKEGKLTCGKAQEMREKYKEFI